MHEYTFRHTLGITAMMQFFGDFFKVQTQGVSMKGSHCFHKTSELKFIVVEMCHRCQCYESHCYDCQ